MTTRVDPLDIVNEFMTRPAGVDPFPNVDYWIKQVCALAERCAKAENQGLADEFPVSDGVKCPHCGNADLDEIIQLNDTSVWRELEEYDEEEQLLTVRGYYRSVEDEHHERYQCKKCYKEFQLSDDIEIDYT